MSPQSKPSQPRQTFLRTVRTLGHAAALLVGAFWLVATSALPEEPRECFTGIAKETQLRVTLGPPIVESDGGTPALPTCDALDGLAPGAALTFDLSQVPNGQYAAGLCNGYQTRTIEGTNDLTLDGNPPFATSDELTAARGTYRSSQLPGCEGSWVIAVGPVEGPPRGELISPLDAGTGQPWIVVRTIYVNQGQLCDGAFAAAGPVQCEDRFSVEGIAVAP